MLVDVLVAKFVRDVAPRETILLREVADLEHVLSLRWANLAVG